MSNTPEMPVVVYDPCAHAASLRAALEKVAVGQTVRGVRYKNGEEERQTDFGPADVNTLRKLMLDAEAACALLTTGQPRRSAIRFSSYRRPYCGGM